MRTRAPFGFLLTPGTDGAGALLLVSCKTVSGGASCGAHSNGSQTLEARAATRAGDLAGRHARGDGSTRGCAVRRPAPPSGGRWGTWGARDGRLAKACFGDGAAGHAPGRFLCCAHLK